MPGSKITWRKRKQTRAPFVENLIKKMSYSSAMAATPHIIHIASVLIEFPVDTGSVWNARRTGPMREPWSLCRQPDKGSHTRDALNLELKQPSVEVAD
jgi:hypothetical protein